MSRVFEWHKWFREGQGKVEDTKRRVRPKSHRSYENAEKCEILSIRQPFKYPRSGSGMKFRQRNGRQNLRDDLCTKKFRKDDPQYSFD
jgi:hypothetical protein